MSKYSMKLVPQSDGTYVEILNGLGTIVFHGSIRIMPGQCGAAILSSIGTGATLLNRTKVKELLWELFPKFSVNILIITAVRNTYLYAFCKNIGMEESFGPVVNQNTGNPISIFVWHREDRTSG